MAPTSRIITVIDPGAGFPARCIEKNLLARPPQNGRVNCLVTSSSRTLCLLKVPAIGALKLIRFLVSRVGRMNAKGKPGYA
jgi:hypothetical protein